MECTRCRLIRLEPRPTYQELGQYYPESYWYTPNENLSGRMEQLYRRLVLRDHVNFVARAVRETGAGGPVLDVGCGGGLFLRMLREQGFPVLGLDNSQAAAAVAWKQNGVGVAVGDLARAPLSAHSFAAVTMFHVLEHLHDPLEYLRSARELLRPNGRLIVQTPNASSWQFLMFGESWNGVDVPRHLVNYRQQDLESVLAQAGFEVVRRKQFSLRDNPAGFATSVAPGLDPMARRVRKIREGAVMKTLKDLVYLALVAGAVPFTVFEAACGAGSTIMLEAKRK